jgi:STE24 endopeptidase
MQFFLILAVLAALMISESGPSLPVSGMMPRLALAAAGMILVALFAQVSSGVIARRLLADFERRRDLLRRFRLLRRVHTALWLIVAGGILYGLDWAQMVRFNWHLGHAPLIDEVLILTPVLLPLVLSWAAFYEVERAVQSRLGGQLAERLGYASRWQYLALHVRHYLGVLLIPVLGLVAVQDVAELIAPGCLKGPAGALVYVPLLLVLFLAFPLMLRYVWTTRPLPNGPLRERLAAAAGRLDFHAREILVWQTGGMMVNAAVTGFVAPLRYVFLTDGLLARLNDEEIEAVFGHEVGHVRHRHLLLRVAAMAAPLCLWLLVVQALPETAAGVEDWVRTAAPVVKLPAGLLVLAGIAGYMLLVFGLYSRLLEFQADVFGCRGLAPQMPGRLPLEAFVSALEKLAAAGGTDRNTPSWQHASIARRVAFLSRLARDPGRERRFQRGVALLNGLILGIVLSPAIYCLVAG